MVVGSASGPQGEAAVEGRVAAANEAKLCGCERCKDATARIQGQSRLSGIRTMAAVVEQQAAAGGTETAGLAEQPAVGDPHRTRRQKENQRKKESRRRKKKPALGARQGGGVVEGGQRQQQAALGASERSLQAGHGDSRVFQEVLGDTNVSAATGSSSQVRAYVKPDTEFVECCEWPAGGDGPVRTIDGGEGEKQAAISTNEEKRAAVSTNGEN